MDLLFQEEVSIKVDHISLAGKLTIPLFEDPGKMAIVAQLAGNWFEK
jgi:hypothetical protein